MIETPVQLPITDELDLHTFRAREVPALLDDYLRECAARQILTVRVVHGKGTGQLREKVHAALRRSERVESFALAGRARGGWGATVVRLHAGPTVQDRWDERYRDRGDAAPPPPLVLNANADLDLRGEALDLACSHPENRDGNCVVSRPAVSNFPRDQGNQGLTRRRTSVRRTSEPAD